MHVRTATVEDAEAIAVVQVRSWQVAYRGHLPQDYLDRRDPVQGRQRWTEWFERNPAPAAVFVAEQETGGVVGFISVAPCGETGTDPRSVGQVQAAYVLPEHWGQGAGRLLMTAALHRLRETGFQEAILWVLATNDRARRFYEAGGWRPDGTEKTEAARGFAVHEIRYAIRLAAAHA